MEIATFFRKFFKKSFKDDSHIQNTEYTLKDILSIVRHIASSQAALKSMDGITHSFKNVALKQRFIPELTTTVSALLLPFTVTVI